MTSAPRVRPFLRLMPVVTAAVFTAAATAADWPHWRGPFQNGQSPETGLPHSWDPDGGEGSNLAWKRDDLGTRSSPVVFEDRLYVLARHNFETRGEQEKVACLDAKTGETLWESIFNIFLTDVPDTRVAWSSPVVDTDTGNVYALGVEGVFRALDGKSGELLWEHSMSEEFGLLTTYGGRTNFPIVFEDLVIVSGVVIGWGEDAKPTHRFYAMDKTTGQVVWNYGTRPLPDDTTYSAPVLAAFNGEAALVFAAGDGGVYAIQPRTGKQLWHYDISTRGINTTPLVVGNIVYCGHSEENIGTTKMGSLFALDGSKVDDGVPAEVFNIRELFCGKSSPLLVGDYLYAIDDRAKLHVLDPETGEEFDDQRMGTAQRSSPVWIDGYIWTIENNGRWFILKPEGDQIEVVEKGRVDGASDGSIAVSNGRIFIPTTEALYCVQAEGEVDSPNQPGASQANAEEPSGDDTPAMAQLVPCEGLLYPSATQRLAVHLFNEAGEFLRDAEADEITYEVEGRGSVEDGVYVPGGDSAGVGRITAKVAGLTATSRFRVVPGLPWDVSFDDGLVPVTWIGARYRCVVLDRELLDRLRESDPTAADLYIYLQSSLTNSGAPKLTFDNSTPAQKYTDLLRFFGLDSGEDAATTAEKATAAFGQSLDILKSEGVLGSYEIGTWQSPGPDGQSVDRPKLTVTPGQRETADGVMVKIRTIPKGTRSQSWMGHPETANYTVTADVMGYTRNGKLPDIGLIAQRYTLDMQGASQKLQIRTWTPQLYMAQTVDFEWKPDTWYTMKFEARAEPSSNRSTLRGKVWERGTEEPAEWTVETVHGVREKENTPEEIAAYVSAQMQELGRDAIEPSAVDEKARDAFYGVPNLNGSPGFFANAKDAEVLYDNIRVTPLGD